jgi:hypothetical protein
MHNERVGLNRRHETGNHIMTEVCEIKWIDDKTGELTPDSNPPIGRARTVARSYRMHGRQLRMEASQWFNICSCHAAKLTEPGMEIWEFEPVSPPVPPTSVLTQILE